MAGEMHFVLKFNNGLKFASAKEVEQEWIDIGVRFLEERLVFN